MMTKRGIAQMGSRMNESAGSQVSSFARGLMEKMGWKEGQGLGKREDGISKHIKVTLREANVGIGKDVEQAAEADSQWWHDGFSSALKSIKEKKGKKKSKKKSKEREGGSREGDRAPTFEELFKATGGARMGMRARASQKGKWQRAEALENGKLLPCDEGVKGDVESDGLSNGGPDIELCKDNESESVEKKSKKRHREKDGGDTGSASGSDAETVSEGKRSKKKKSKKSKKDGASDN